MPTINIHQIRITNRQRKTIVVNDIEKLAESIRLIGLMHPIVIDNDNNLIAGECRIRAYQYLGRSEIECTRFSDLTAWDRSVMELEENLRRTNLTYAEEVLAVKKLHDLHQQKHGTIPTLGGEGKYPVWKLEDTATLLGISTGNISQKVQLATAIEKNPELGKLKSETQAWNTFQRGQEIKTRQLMARLITAKQAEDKPIGESDSKFESFTDSGITIYQASCLDIIPTLDDNSINCLLTDPPWQVEFDSTFMSDTDQNMLDLTASMLEMVKSKLSPGALCWMFCASKHLVKGTIYSMIQKLGYSMFEQFFIWYKPQTAHSSHPYNELKNDYEPAILFSKSTARSFNFPMYAVKSASSPSRKVHPAQKPDEVIELIVSNSTTKHELVLDPFCGSGRVGAVCKKLSRRAIMVDSDSRWFSSAVLEVKNA
uniref:Putative methyltransferase n=1 Tax=viral metagenome TaxID=1070528 RepID=A0A6M3K2P8_9ZZZZ